MEYPIAKVRRDQALVDNVYYIHNCLTRNVDVSIFMNIFLFLQSFAIVLALHVFLHQINIFAPANEPQEFLHSGPDHHEIQTNDVITSNNATHHDAQHEVTNTSSLQLSFEHAHSRRARQISGCLNSTSVEHCGKDLIVTVKCRKRSITCIHYGGAAPRCVTKKSYYPACGKVFNVDCQCEGKSE